MAPTEVDIARGDVVECIVVAAVVVVVDETSNFLLEAPREVIGLRLNDVFQRPVIALDFALGSWDGILPPGCARSHDPRCSACTSHRRCSG